MNAARATPGDPGRSRSWHSGTGETDEGAVGLPAPAVDPAIAPEQLRRFGGGAVGPFSQMLVVGLVVCALSLPLVTAVPALAAGVFHLEQHLASRGDSLGHLLRAAWLAIRGGWWVGLLAAAVLGLLAINISAAVQGLVPGGTALVAVSGVVALGIVVVTCRAAALWRPGERWGDLLREGRELAVTDPVGSLFVILGLGVCAVVIWMLPPLVVITPGMLAIALVAAERRRAARGPVR